MNSPLLSAQTKALEALKSGAALIGLVPGAGKTRIAIEHAREIGARTIVVVCPAIAVTGVWPSEVARWWP
jgi:superfamily II DNA or RNA helicase